ncbi:MAG: DUF3106 domain-containing protein [Burkholderiales bacterium]
MAQDFVRTLMAVAAAGVLLAAAPVTHAQIALKSPMWLELSVQEREILAPLASDWDKFDAARKSKWRGIAQRYPKMQPDEQQRVHEQMRPWSSLTPEQRQTAREQYKNMKKLPPDKKEEVRQKWMEYQQLPTETKRELASKAPPGNSPARATAPLRAPAPPMTPPQVQQGPSPASVPPPR